MDILNDIAKSCKISRKIINDSYREIIDGLTDILPIPPDNKDLKKLIGYFDFSIANYIYIYNVVSAEILKGKYHFGDKKYPKDINFSFILMLKLITQDLITLRNLALIGFDAQFHSISRNFVEKNKIFLLCCYDREFFEAFSGYKNISEEDLYKLYTCEKKVNERIKILAKKLYFDPTLKGLSNDNLKNRTNILFHPFVHTNNYKQLLRYYGPKISIPIYDRKAGVINTLAYNYMCEASILYVTNIILWSEEYKTVALDRYFNLILDVYQNYIEDYYK